jgi:hypothetical protein
MKKLYNQSNITILIDGVPLLGLMDGTPLVVGYKGGEVEPTEGMDGPGLNMATRQGGYIHPKLKESSLSRTALHELRRMQELAGIPVTVTVRSGTDIVYILGEALVSLPGELSTGDKKMGGIEYKFIGTTLDEF